MIEASTLDVHFIRHGEKLAEALTPRGVEQAVAYAQAMSEGRILGVRSSTAERVRETMTWIACSRADAEHLPIEPREELAIPPMSQEALRRFRALEATGDPDAAAEWFLSFGDRGPDAKSASPAEAARRIGSVLWAEWLAFDGERPGPAHILNGTHQTLVESLLQRIMVRRTSQGPVTGFTSLREIGGALRFAEGAVFRIAGDTSKKTLKLLFRGEQHEVDLARLEALLSAERQAIS